MKRYFIFVTIILGMIAPSVLAQTAKQKVAVYVTGEADSGYKKVIGSKLVTGITRSEGYTAIERTSDFLAELNKEQDYQMSGAVSDNQIARLGQQFGVRYVLVADISEVFESMFISARMIDVQTAQITNSTEADAVVDNMESLTKIAENIVLRLLYVKEYAKDEIKVLGPFSTVKDLVYCTVPENYRIATKDEVVKIIKNNQIISKRTYLPIYTDIGSKSTEKHQDFWVYPNGKGKGIERMDRLYNQVVCTYTFIKDVDLTSALNSTFYIDDLYYAYYGMFNFDGDSTIGLSDMSTNPTITPGYVYVIKKEEKE